VARRLCVAGVGADTAATIAAAGAPAATRLHEDGVSARVGKRIAARSTANIGYAEKDSFP
jgi:hypothetical protein